MYVILSLSFLLTLFYGVQKILFPLHPLNLIYTLLIPGHCGELPQLIHAPHGPTAESHVPFPLLSLYLRSVQVQGLVKYFITWQFFVVWSC